MNSWQKVAELRYCVDEATPGMEEQWLDKRRFGKKLDVAVDPDWPAFPRLELSEKRVIADTVGCATEPGVELTVVEITGDDDLDMPPPGTVYLNPHNGADFDTVYLYLNVAYVGEAVYVNYEYYPDDDAWAFIALKDGALLVASYAGRFYRYDGELKRIYDSPDRPNGLTRDAVWAGGRSLFHFGREHRPAIREVGREESPRTLAASAATAFGARLRYSPNRRLSLTGKHKKRTATVLPENLLSIKGLVYRSYDAVRVVFDGGSVVTGSGREKRVNLPTVSDVGIAKAIAKRIKREVERDVRKYAVSLMGDYDISVGDTLSVPGAVFGTVVATKRYLDKERTDVEFIESKGAIGIEQGK
ncbi:MAG: hypothetical protein GY771_14075 [bacterium]|nr:hypothetical protein [bacterium]